VSASAPRRLAARRGRPPGPRRAQITERRRAARALFPPGKQITVRFDRMGPDGEALATVDGRIVAVPYAAPGEEASVRILEARGGMLRGRLVALRSVSGRIATPRCPHFGVCGGCQWQHLEYPAQLEQKTGLVREALERAGVADVLIEPTAGWEPPWEFRTQLEAVVGARDGRPVLGFYAWGGDRIVRIQQCPVQHPGNVAVLRAVRAAWESLVPVLAGSVPGQVSLRAIRARVGAATGEVLLGLGVSEPLSVDGRAAVVRSLLDRIPGLVSIMEVRLPGRGPMRAGRRATLLWGRPYLREEAAGVRYHVPLLGEFPLNARALPGLLEMILTQLDAGPADTVVEGEAGIGAYTVHLALSAGRVIGLTREDHLEAAWANAHLNRLTNVMFYVRAARRALEKVQRYGRARLAFLHPSGGGVAPDALGALRRAGVVRLVYLGRALGTLGRDAHALRGAGFRLVRVQPVDLSPQTSRVHALLTCVAD
jgi:23S rRNA (uracil1939-C5)-methyltransferase